MASASIKSASSSGRVDFQFAILPPDDWTGDAYEFSSDPPLNLSERDELNLLRRRCAKLHEALGRKDSRIAALKNFIGRLLAELKRLGDRDELVNEIQTWLDQ